LFNNTVNLLIYIYDTIYNNILPATTK